MGRASAITDGVFYGGQAFHECLLNLCRLTCLDEEFLFGQEIAWTSSL